MSKLFSCFRACHKQGKTIPKPNNNPEISAHHNV